MHNPNTIWLNIEEICSLTGEIKETVRRKCKDGRYISIFRKEGKRKIYNVKLSSLPIEFQNKYFNKNDGFEDSKFNDKYSNSTSNKKEQADKYLELLELTKDITRKEIKKFLET